MRCMGGRAVGARIQTAAGGYTFHAQRKSWPGLRTVNEE